MFPSRRNRSPWATPPTLSHVGPTSARPNAAWRQQRLGSVLRRLHDFRSCHSWESWDLAERRSEEHTSELQSLMRISDAVFCLKKKKTVRIFLISSNLIFIKMDFLHIIYLLQLIEQHA